MKRNGAGVLSSKATMDSKTLPDSTTCTFLAEGNGSGLKGKINSYNSGQTYCNTTAGPKITVLNSV